MFLFFAFYVFLKPVRPYFVGIRPSYSVNFDDEIDVHGFKHHFIESLNKLTYHFVTRGDPNNPIILFAHGAPDTWHLWINQMLDLSKDYFTVAFDLKGYGQTAAPIMCSILEGTFDCTEDFLNGKNREIVRICNQAQNFSRSMQADEIMHCVNQLVGENRKFYFVSEDWGSMIGTAVAGRYPERILKYIRAQMPVAAADPANWVQVNALRCSCPKKMILEGMVAKNPLARWWVRAVVTFMSNKRPDEAQLKITTEEWLRNPFAINGWVSSFLFLERFFQEQIEFYAKYSFPTLLLQAHHDRQQQVPDYDGSRTSVFDENGEIVDVISTVDEGKVATEYFPQAKMQWMVEVGHFFPYEIPKRTTRIIRSFFETDFDQYEPDIPYCMYNGELYSVGQKVCNTKQQICLCKRDQSFECVDLLESEECENDKAVTVEITKKLRRWNWLLQRIIPFVLFKGPFCYFPIVLANLPLFLVWGVFFAFSVLSCLWMICKSSKKKSKKE